MVLSKIFHKDEDFFEKLRKHADLIYQCADTFKDLLFYFNESKYNVNAENKVIACYKIIDDLEEEADEITTNFVRSLHTAFITPIDREQLHSLINYLDDIIDLIQDVSHAIHLYDVKKLSVECLDIGANCSDCCKHVKYAIDLLCNLRKKPSIEQVLENCEKIEKLESKADRLLYSAISKLFREEENVKEILKMKMIVELLESITDKCEDVANLIENIVLENS